jgi:23S rRNA pseudouridine1911/1915/1917 synthase
VLFARTSKAADRLSAQFRERGVTKDYLGVVLRAPRHERGELEQHLLKDSTRNVVSTVREGTPGAKRALTGFELLRSSGDEHLLALHPHTGRAHQLRVACALGLGAPLAGDLKYGAPRPLSDKSIALHAHRLGFDHPTRGERLEFELEPPAHPVWAIARGG